MSIVVHNLGYTHPDGEKLFNSVSFSIQEGEKVALIGANGCGKSTIFKILAGQIQPTEGEISITEKLCYLPQQFNLNESQTIAEALGVSKKIEALQAILKGSVDEKHYQDLEDDWDIENRLQRNLAKWKMGTIDIQRKMKSLSGGEKTKIALTRIALDVSKIILLDEPSNHLDLDARLVLYQFIKESVATIMVISHDRALLNQLEVMLELTPNGLERYGGNYDFYKVQRTQQEEAFYSQLKEQEKNIRQSLQRSQQLAEQRQKKESRGRKRKEKGGLPRIIAGGLAGKAQQTTSRMKAEQEGKVEQLKNQLTEIHQRIKESIPLKIQLSPSDTHFGKILVQAKAINVRYNAIELWEEPLSFHIKAGDRVHLLGANGSGKTTLIQLVQSKLKVSTGCLFVADFTSLYIDQEYSLLEDEKTLMNQMQVFNEKALPESELYTLLHRHQFPSTVWDKKCKQLSGGEKMKLLLCCMSLRNNTPDLLLLDEPTNNIDVQSQEILSDVLKEYKGTMLVVSHDTYFVEQIDLNKAITLM
ncbi:MAG: ABC-F family ATP-binding cassette domain-containing protein [Bacteroidales bacterium]|nr:ABC-F family ATP-binding cassette domain-containing protein [Bacteroidales bacterium]